MSFIQLTLAICCLPHTNLACELQVKKKAASGLQKFTIHYRKTSKTYNYNTP